ncbi:MAG: hypothetical protein WC713_02490, partial [Candidatus Methylomirabilota bacterium]
MHVTQSGTNSTSYMWEDATWHWDWNDLSVRIDWQSTPCPVAQCSDGIDNDQDGAADYPNDFSCSSATDNDETNPKAQCQDGIDNDGDGRTDYPSDPGCSSKQDNSEKNSTGPQCDNGIDDDQDGKTDYPQDPGCTDPTDNSENTDNLLPILQISKVRTVPSAGIPVARGDQIRYLVTVKNTGNGTANGIQVIDPIPSYLTFVEGSPACRIAGASVICDQPSHAPWTLNPGEEHTYWMKLTIAPTTTCNTSLQNRAQIVSTNHTAVWSNTVSDTITCAQCSDGIDNDQDGAADYPNDFSCSSATDNDETNPKAQCQDGIDNDGDGRTDYPSDPGCSSKQDNDEHNICPVATQTSTCRCATNADCTVPDTCQSGICRPTGADLSITKSGPSSIIAGNTILYTVTASNAGPNTATNVVVADVIPSGLTFNAGQSSAGCVLNGNGISVLCNNFNLTSGQSRTFTIAFTVPAGFPCGGTNVIVNQATVSSSQGDPVTANNISTTVTTPVTCPIPQADLSIRKSGPSSVLRGDTVTYTVTVENAGPNTATNVVVSDVIPFGLTFNAAGSSAGCILNGAGTSVLCNNFNLNAGESRTFTLSFTTSTSLSCGVTIHNTADVSSSSNDPVSSNNHSTTVSTFMTCPTADITIVKSGPQSVNRGGNILYTLTVTNLGPQRSDNVVVVDRPESMAGLTFIAAQTDSDCVLNGTEILCNNISLQAGQSRTYNIVFAISSTFTCGSTIANRANANVSTPDPHGDNNWSDRIVTTVNCAQCSDGIDNDQDGATDYPNDFSCDSPTDNDETNPRSQCQDGVDNDGDQMVDYPNDSGCSSAQDNDEYNVVLNPDATIQKSGPTTVIRGNTVSYTVTVTNIGAATAQNVVVSDVIPAGLTYQSGLSSPECVLNGGGTSVLCNNFSLAAGQTRTFTVAFTVTSGIACGSTILNTATVSTSNDTNPANNGSQWNTNVQCITPQCSDGIDNDQDGALDYPNDFSCSSPTDDDETFPKAQCQDGVDNDQDGAVDYPADIGCTSAQDNDESNPASPDLSITKTGPQTVNRGSTVSYTVTVTNIGTATALNAVVADVIPAGLTFHGGLSSTDCLLNGGGTSVLCNNFSLAAGQTKNFTIAFTVPTTVTCGSMIRNTATVSTSNDQNGSNNTSQTVSTTVECPVLSADLGITKTANVSSVMTGDPVSYTLMVTNSGPESASNVVIGDALPAGVAFDVLFTQTNGFSCYRQSSDANHLVCVRPSMAAGETATIRYQARVINQGTCTPRSLANTANVTALSGTDPNSGNNYSQASVQLSCPAPTFAITKTDNRTTIQPGEILSYTITVTNTSDINGSNVTVTDALPANVTFLSASDAGTLTSNIVTWQNLSIPAHMSKTLTATVQVEYSATNGTIITNTATVAGISAQDQTIVQTPVTADLSITKTGPQLALLGSTILYTVTVYNAGPGTEPNATVTDVVPTGLTFLPQQSSAQCALTSGTVTCSGITLAQGQSQSFTLAFQIPISVACGAILLNNAEVHGSNDPNCVNDLSQTVTTAVQCINPTFTISKTDGRTTAQPGETLTYMISVTNTSAVNATNVTVTDVLPTLTTFITASDGGTASSGIVTWSNLSIAAGATKHLTVQGVVSQTAAHGAVLTNYATVAGQTAQDSTTIQIPQTSADLSIIKTGPMTAQQGSIALYTVTVYNAGPSASQNVVIGDVIPAGFTFNQTNSSPECVLNGTSSSVLCNNFTLTAGQSRSFTIAFNVTSTATCNAVIQNTATVSTSNDPNGSNNTSQTVSTTVQCPTPTFTISKTDNQTVVLPGATLTYVVSVTNTSQVNATNVTVTDVLP